MIASLVLISAIGISKIKVENRFIDYFHSDTEIYQGMLEIDKQLGGTTPLDIIIDKPIREDIEANDFELDEDFDDLSELLGDNNEELPGHWLTNPTLKDIETLHTFLEAQPDTGKVLSIDTLYKLAKGLNDDEPLSDLQVGAIKDSLSSDVKKVLLEPYLSENEEQTRITLRVIDSDKNLNRKEFIQRVENVSEEMGYTSGSFNTTNMLVLYHNMLQSLFSSQYKQLDLFFIIFIFIVCLDLFI